MFGVVYCIDGGWGGWLRGGWLDVCFVGYGGGFLVCVSVWLIRTDVL